MKTIKIISVAMLITALIIGAVSAEEQGPFAIGTRFVFISPSAKFDHQLSNGGNQFNDDFKPDIFIQFYPAMVLALEYSVLVSEHAFKYGIPTQVAGSTWLATQSLSAKLYLAPDSFITPYVGGGINILTPYSTTNFADHFSIDNHAGWMAQTGFDMHTSKNTWFNFDYRFMDMDTQARINGNSYRFDISPHVFAFGVKYRY